MKKLLWLLLPAVILAGCGQVNRSAAGDNPPAVSAAARKTKANPFGTLVVRFKPGTKGEQMSAAVQAAGGEVLVRLDRLSAVSAAAVAADFAARIKADPLVRAVFAERVFSAPAPDVAAEDAGLSGKNDPQLGSPGPSAAPDPWHNLPSFLGETNPEGILQWDDNRMNVPAAWGVTQGNRTVRVAVIDSGVEGAHKELLPNYDNQASANTIPCNTLTRLYGPKVPALIGDCSSGDTDGHGTWVASRIAGAANGFASNGVAPGVQMVGFKALATGFGGFTSWIVDAMVKACDADVDLINMSLGGFNDLSPEGQEDYLLWVDAVNYCRGRGTAILASAGNDHVRIDRVNMTIGGRALVGVGRVSLGNEGYASVFPGDVRANYDYRGLLEVPAGVPGVIMVSSTSNANGAPPAGYGWQSGLEKPPLGARDQLAYYSNYGARIDIGAPGGARKLGVPRYDGGPADILYGGWGTLAGLTANGEICQDPALSSLLTFACFKVNGAAFGWLQGTSMSSPNATGVAALTLAAHPQLQGNPDALLAHLRATARVNMVNRTGPNDPANFAPSFTGVPCLQGFCHVDFDTAVPFADAYGAGIVDAGRAVTTTP